MNQILQRIKRAYHLETDAEVANFLDIKPSTLSMQKNRGRLNLERIIQKCSELNKNWLLDGVGEMWEPEQSGRRKIPIFTSLKIVDGNSLNFQESIKSADIFTDIGSNGLEFPITENVIGYAVSADVDLQILKKNDIAFVDLTKKAPRDGTPYLLSTPQKVICGRIVERSGEYVLHKEDNKSMNERGNFSILGEVIGLMRKCDL